MASTVQIDDARWPLVSVRFVGDLVESDFDEYLSYLNRNMDRAEKARCKTAVVFDARQVGRVLPSIRSKMAAWIRANTLQTSQTCAGFGFVIDSQLVRGLLTAVLWIVPIPAPHTVAATLSEAEDFLKLELARHGVQITGPRFSLPPAALPKNRV